MENLEVRALVEAALRAANPREGSLLDFHDLQAMLGKLALATQQLLDERDGLSQRLSRTNLPHQPALHGPLHA